MEGHSPIRAFLAVLIVCMVVLAGTSTERGGAACASALPESSARESPETIRAYSVACGPHAIWALLRACGKDIPLDEIRRHARYHPQGISLLEIQSICRTFGLSTRIVYCDHVEDLKKASPPFLLVRRQAGRGVNFTRHFMLVTSIGKDTLQVIDTTTGEERTYYFRLIENVWDRYLILPVSERNILLDCSLFVVIAIGLARNWRAVQCCCYGMLSHFKGKLQ